MYVMTTTGQSRIPNARIAEGGAMPEKKEWNIVSNHGAVLLMIAESPESTMREIALSLRITERQVARIIRDLEEGGIVCVTRRGRQNLYAVQEDVHFRRPVLAHIRVGDYVALMRAPAPSEPSLNGNRGARARSGTPVA